MAVSSSFTPRAPELAYLRLSSGNVTDRQDVIRNAFEYIGTYGIRKLHRATDAPLGHPGDEENGEEDGGERGDGAGRGGEKAGVKGERSEREDGNESRRRSSPRS
jgi:hypothetical protein